MPDDSVRTDGRHELESAPVHAVLALQRSAGNQAVTRRLVQRVKKSIASAAEHRVAEAMHARDRDALAGTVLASLESADERLRNSAQWIVEGKTLLYALTPTADATARAETAKKPGMRALFGYPDPDPFKPTHVAGHVFDSTVASYDQDDMESNARVTFDAPDSGGFRTPTGGKIFINEPSRIDAINALRKELDKAGQFAPITEVLKHETQHEADTKFNTEAASVRGDADVALVEYRTEFRAYTAQEPDWVSAPPLPKDIDRFGLHFPDPKQFQIFSHIYNGYARVKKAWNEDAELSNGERFRTAVLQTRGSIERISSNPYNSPRVVDFYPLVRRTNSRNDPDDPVTSELIAALRRFDDHDRQAIGRSDHYPWDGLNEWIEALIGALLRDPATDVDTVLAEERERRRQEAEATRVRARQKAPTRDVLLKGFNDWADVRECLETVVTKQKEKALDNEDVNDELGTWSKWAFAEGIEPFAENLDYLIDWWAVLDGRGVR